MTTTIVSSIVSPASPLNFMAVCSRTMYGPTRPVTMWNLSQPASAAPACVGAQLAKRVQGGGHQHEDEAGDADAVADEAGRDGKGARLSVGHAVERRDRRDRDERDGELQGRNARAAPSRWRRDRRGGTRSGAGVAPRRRRRGRFGKSAPAGTPPPRASRSFHSRQTRPSTSSAIVAPAAFRLEADAATSARASMSSCSGKERVWSPITTAPFRCALPAPAAPALPRPASRR